EKAGTQTIDFGTITFTKAGTYTIEVKGTADGQYKRKSTTMKFNVAKADISGAGFVPSPAGEVYFTGVDKTVSFQLAATGEKALGNYDPVDEHNVVVMQTDGTITAVAKSKENDQEFIDAVENPGDQVSVKWAFAEGDYDASTKVVHDAGSYDVTVTGTGNCTGSTATTFQVQKAPFLTEDKAFIADSAEDSGYEAIDVTAATLTDPASGVAAIDVPVNKAQSPVELVYSFDEDPAVNPVKLVEGQDYSVAYYVKNSDLSKGDKLTAGSLPSEVGQYYYAEVTMSNGSANFAWQDGAKTLVTCTVAESGTLESFVSRVVLPNATYLGGEAVTVTTEGATFYDKDGKDVTALVGTNSKLLMTNAFEVLATNTANTALTSAEDGKSAGSALGAGSYVEKLGVTGDKGYTPDDGIDAYLTVEPRVAKEGTEIGDLKVTVKPTAYNGGNYIKMDKQVSVQMYKSKSGALQNIDKEQALKGYMGEKVTNWSVKYYKDGKQVTLPTETGTYQAVFKFSGNLAGTPDITKEFTVDTGDITTQVAGLKFLANADEDNPVWKNPTLTFTGDALDISKDDLYLVDDEDEIVDPDVLVGTDYTLSYEKGTATPVDGKPLAAGNYVVKATFTGNYTGTVEGILIVDKLVLTGITPSGNDSAELQYQAADGSWDTAYSAAKTGSAIEPTARVVVKDGKEKGEKATVVNPSVYTIAFSNNTEAGKANVTLAAASNQAANVTGSSVAQKNAFTITDKSFESVGATLELSKASDDYSDSIAPITLQLKTNEGPLSFSSDADGFLKGTAKQLAAIADTTLYKKGDKYYTWTAAQTEAKYELADENKWVALDGTGTLTNPDGVVPGKVVAKADDSDVVANVYKKDDGYVTYTTQGAYTLYEAKKVAEFVPAVAPNSYYDGYTKGTGKEDLLAEATVYKKAGKYYSPDTGTLVDEDDNAVTDFVQDEATSGANFSLKVLDSEGKTVEGVEFAATEAPYTTVTMSGIKKAGVYTIVAGAGESGQYGGRVTATYTVNGLDISDTSKFAITWSAQRSATDASVVKHGIDEAWAIDYNAGYAKKSEGMTLEQQLDGIIEVAGGPKYVKGAKDNDVKVTYENNFQAGTAKVTFEGQGNYTGKVEKEFTINRAQLTEGYMNAYKVEFITTPSFKKVTKYDGVHYVGSYCTGYTGAAITPDFEVNYYNNEGEVESMLEDAYTVQWSNNIDVAYQYNSSELQDAATVKITATGNYEGYITGTFYIDPVDLSSNSDVVVTPVSDQVYTGQRIIPAVSVSLNGNALTQDKDYVVTLAAGDNGTDEGEHTALVASAGQGNVTVSTPIAVPYTIKKAEEISYDLTGAKVALSKASFTYNKKAQAPTVTSVTLADGTLLDAALYTATIPASKAAGSYTVEVKGATDNVTGTATAKYTIAKAANTLKVAKAKQTVKYAKLKKAAQKVNGLKVKTAGQGTMVYKVTKVVKGKKSIAKKNFKVAKSSVNKLTVKKGLAKGTYKVTMTAKAKGNANYNASKALKKVVTVVVK
ncbi:MAG: hypothetical protein IJ087_15490, partial [Eggerthellaceae bacterium]|nr:hypothetical protein [Eggerthellaceae bacterium]